LLPQQQRMMMRRIIQPQPPLPPKNPLLHIINFPPFGMFILHNTPVSKNGYTFEQKNPLTEIFYLQANLLYKHGG